MITFEVLRNEETITRVTIDGDKVEDAKKPGPIPSDNLRIVLANRASLKRCSIEKAAIEMAETCFGEVSFRAA